MLNNPVDKCRKVLVISNACFSNTDSNGRTLAQLFSGFSSNEIAQFFVYGIPDFSVCQDYYKVTDYDALTSFLRQKEVGDVIKSAFSDTNYSDVSSVKKRKKTPRTMLLREIAWKYGRWNGKKLHQWLDKIQPKCIVLFVADNIFLLELAYKVAEKYQVPIIMYSTEDYYFKEYNYITKKRSIAYKMFHEKLKKAYHKIEKYVAKGLFNTQELAMAYGKAFQFPCEALYAKSDIDFIENATIPTDHKKVVVSYLGNMGLNRHKALIALADMLSEVDPDIKLNVYGKIPENAREDLLENSNILYRGFVDYEEVVRVMHSSTLLVHVEDDNAFYNIDLKHAFSTKIADSVCSGTPFLIYAPEMLAETKFLKRQKCAFVVSEPIDLKNRLQVALFNLEERQNVLQNARIAKESIFTNKNELKKVVDEYTMKKAHKEEENESSSN